MAWGKLHVINLYNCSEKRIKNKKIIAKFMKKLCREINMNPFGKTIIKKFGKNSLKGYSAFQFIETSSITVHFDETENRAFIDIFSCKNFNLEKTEKFCREFFKAERATSKTFLRK